MMDLLFNIPSDFIKICDIIQQKLGIIDENLLTNSNYYTGYFYKNIDYITTIQVKIPTCTR
jgi:hypothetical protein